MPTTNVNVKATVAIFGGTGDLGIHISKIFLTEYRWAFPTICITTRDPASAKAQELAKLGGELYSFNDSLHAILAGVDLAVNVLPTSVAPEFKAELLHALVRNNVKVYFPSEYAGYDYIHDNLFPGYEHEEWAKKRALALETRAILEGKVKIINLNTGGFLTWWIGPGRVFNWDPAENVYNIVGPSTVKNTLTHQSDIGRAVAQISVLALDPATASTVPTDIRIAGNVVNYENLRDIVSRVEGIPRGEIICKDIAAAKDALSQDPTSNILDYVVILTGEGNMDFTVNDNEFVNPGQSLWKWKTVEDEFRGL
ncbi:hypothetical protein DICSQDRAFT_146106 [Dichomitus squalens LYAD-421 SS1]|uniref:uncharacterized protein n=1 Tax=Dichomitus squalens (strain LYAD-421) TaxID=732165 RepID=UPI0004411A59|nr:uncharacterized protein DICSQDRAFT_146106 [Dichomitus squalens LYAD-421 SS1]EJF63131.1 hypothetical protein DICSQDRAFT_146106 [Dichomitus squalens LYAD-421 SS1]